MRQYLEKKGYKFKESGAEVTTNCMFCGDTKLHLFINLKKGVFFCHKCGAAGNKFRLLNHFGELNISKLIKSPTSNRPEKDKDEKLVLTLAQEATKYLKMHRGFTSETIKDFKLGYDGEYISIPYYKNRELVNIKYISIKEKKFKREEGCESTLFNIDNIDKTKDIIITEGEFDCIAATQLGFKNIVSVSIGAGSFDNSWIDTFDSCGGSFYICYDNDVKGEEGAENLARKIGIERCYRVKLPAKDFNDCLMSGLTRENLQEYFRGATQYDLNNVKHFGQLLDQVEAMFRKEDKGAGLQLKNWQHFNECIGGLRSGEITVITGDTGSGKSTVALNIVYDLVCQGKGVLIASTEMATHKVIAKLFTIYKKKPFQDFTEEDYGECVKFFMEKRIFFVAVHGRLSIGYVSECMDYVKRKYEIEYVLLDHLHFFLENEGSDRIIVEIDRFMKGIIITSLKTKQHIFLIAHPAKLDNKEGKVTMNDIKNSSTIKQDAHNVITIWRDRDTEESTPRQPVPQNKVYVDFQKVRDDSGPGGKILFYFDYPAQTYREIYNDIRT